MVVIIFREVFRHLFYGGDFKIDKEENKTIQEMWGKCYDMCVLAVKEAPFLLILLWNEIFFFDQLEYL